MIQFTISVDMLPDGRWAWNVTDDTGMSVGGRTESETLPEVMLTVAQATVAMRKSRGSD